MKKMRKLLLLGLLVVGFTALGLGVYQHTSADSYSSNGTCGTFDLTHFPYGFLCGGANGDNTPTSFSRPDANFLVVNAAPGTPRSFPAGSRNSIDFTTSFHAADISISRSGLNDPFWNDAPVLVWTYVLANQGNRGLFAGGDDSIAGFNYPNAANITPGTNNIDGSGGHVIACPGKDSPVGKVYNYVAGNESTNNQPDVSPAAYNPSTGEGVEDCGDHGDVVYWYLPGGMRGGQNYQSTFRLNLNPAASGSFCVRTNISVAYRSDNNQRFPPAGAGLADESYIANNVAKQSVPGNCYTISNSKQEVPVKADMAPLSCSPGGIHVSMHDDNDRGTGVRYYVYVWHGNQLANLDWNTAQELTGSPPPGEPPGYPPPRADGDIFLNWPAERAGVNSGWTVEFRAINIKPDGTDSPIIDGNDFQKAQFIGPCYQAHCSASVDSIVPGDSSGVPANHGFDLTVTFYNDGASPLPGSLAQDNGNTNLLGGWVHVESSPNFGTAGTNIPGGIPAGGSATVKISLPYAPSGMGSWTVSPYLTYEGLFVVGAACPVTVNTYLHYALTPEASIDSPDSEDPTNIAYTGTVRPQVPDTTYPYATYLGGTHTVFTNLDSYLKYNPVAGGSTMENDLAKSGNYGSSSTPTSYSTVWPAPPATNPNPIVAGDKYCALTKLDNANGWVTVNGAGSVVFVDQQPATSSGGCLTVVNEPTFKVYGKGVSAGGGFSDNGDSSSAGGELAGWNNTGNAVPGHDYEFGAGSQLSALALVKIVGFASGQTVATRAPGGLGVDLSLANSTLVDSPPGTSLKMGGAFGGNHWLSNITPSGTATTGPVTFGGGFSGLPAGSANDKSLYVNGDIFITNDIQYPGVGNYDPTDPTNPATNTVRSAIIKAQGGNIYIANNVTHLDGVYVAERDNTTGKGGNIYSCWDGSTPGQTPVDNRNNLYANCNNQLTVTGSFIADKVNLARTYGSLRDEKPTVAAVTTTTITNPKYGFNWRTSDDPSQTCAQVYQDEAYIGPGGLAGNRQDPLGDWLCVSQASGVKLTMYTWAGKLGAFCGFGIPAAKCAENATNLPNCQDWAQKPGVSAILGAFDDYMCTSAPDATFSANDTSDNSTQCNKEPSWAAYWCEPITTTTTTSGGSQIGLVWSCGGSTCNPSTAGLRCTSMNVTSEDPSHTWGDNKLCVPNGSSVQLALTTTTVPNTPAKAAADTGQPNCTSLKIPGEGNYWDDNYLCSNANLTFTYKGSNDPAVAGQYCTPIIEPSDPDAGNAWHSNKTFLCEPLASAPSPPTPPLASSYPGICSHLGITSSSNRLTCASEVFDFNPLLYLSNPNIKLPNNGAPKYQAITSLPPVL